MLTHPDEDDRRILLADFGVARQLADISGITETNVAVGTVAYAAPEQLVGSNMDGRADQYALAASAFHLLTGAPPYRNSNPVAVIGQHLHAELPRLSDYRPDLADLDDVFFKALAKDPADRFDRCRQFAAAFSEHISRRRRSRHQVRRARDEVAATAPLRRAERRPKVVTESRHRHRDDRHDGRRADRDVGDLILLLGRPASSGLRVTTARAARRRRLPAASAIAAPPLNGSYRLDYDRAKQTSNGVIRNNGGVTSWWAFSSACTAAGCAATATKLDDASHQTAKTTGTGNTGVLHFVDGHWQGEPRQLQVQCQKARGAPTVTQSETVVWSLTPEPDGTLRGVQTQTVQSNECGSQGATLRIPVVATRTGDVPPNVTVADPAQAANITATPVGTPTPAVLGGPCSDIDKVAYDSTANEQVVCEANTWDKAPTTTGVHPVGTSCDEPGTSVFSMSMSDDGHLIQCDPGTRVWTRQHS